MSSEPGRPLRQTSCPDFSRIETGVGTLPVPPGIQQQLHIMYHNRPARGRHDLQAKCFDRVDITEPRTATQTPSPTPRHPLRIQKRSPPPLPPPSLSYPALIKQWERLLTWATLKTLQDFQVMPARPAREVSRRLAIRILADYGPSLHKWLGRRTPESTRSGGNST